MADPLQTLRKTRIGAQASARVGAFGDPGTYALHQRYKNRSPRDWRKSDMWVVSSRIYHPNEVPVDLQGRRLGQRIPAEAIPERQRAALVNIHREPRVLAGNTLRLRSQMKGIPPYRPVTRRG